MDVLKVCSASSNETEKAELLQHHQKDGSSESSYLATKPEDNHSSRGATSSPSPSKPQQLSPETEFLLSDPKLDSSSHEQPKNVSHLNGFERSSSSSGVYRYSGDQMPNYLTALDNGSINGPRADAVHRYGLVKRSNSASEFISFSAEWRPKYTIVD
ncbi:uncharacterized protein LOC114579124 [Dendrobium catenatum]|uniref:uncharacterized protein LOC114579124 n=1 Tax=Dendrobium catenatum TaxID=906689 RepID=UPI0010A082F2|nr:uncharacterized protein LOC114579124 [Dendrobium catenatum]